MLQFIRDKASSWIVKVLFIVLVLSFAVWGVGDIFRGGGPQRTVAEVGDTEITTPEVDREFRQLLNQYRQLFGGQFDIEQARQFGLIDRAVETLVQQALYMEAAREAGLRVGDDLLRREVQKVPAFRNAAGQFDPNQFRLVLQQNGLSEQGFVEMLRTEIIRNQLVGAVTAGVDAPDPLVSDLFRFRGERRVAEVIDIPAARFNDIPEPDEGALSKFHREHPDRFMRPETRDMVVLKLTTDDVMDEVSASDEEIAQLYQARITDFRQPERRTLVMVQANDEETAHRIADAAKESGDITAAAAAAGTEAIPVERATREQLFPEEVREPAFATPEGGVAGPLQTPLGWYLVGVKEVQPATEKTLAEVREQLSQTVRREKAAERLYDMANRIEDALAGGATLEETAERNQLRLERIQGVDATGRVAGGAQAPAIPGLAQVLGTAFSQDQGTTSRLLESREGTYYAVRVDGITRSALPPLAEIRDQVAAAWKAEEQMRRAGDLARSLVGEIEGGKSLESVAATHGLNTATTQPLSRSPSGSPLPPSIHSRLFEMKSGGLTLAESPGGWAIARLVEVQAADPAASEPQVRQLSEQVDQTMARDLLAQFTGALRQAIPVDINRRAIEELARSN